jgi:hypothetical protein
VTSSTSKPTATNARAAAASAPNRLVFATIFSSNSPKGGALYPGRLSKGHHCSIHMEVQSP